MTGFVWDVVRWVVALLAPMMLVLALSGCNPLCGTDEYGRYRCMDRPSVG